MVVTAIQYGSALVINGYEHNFELRSLGAMHTSYHHT